MELKEKTNEPMLIAYALTRGDSAFDYRLIRVVYRGKAIERSEIIYEDVLPMVVAMAERLMRYDAMNQ